MLQHVRVIDGTGAPARDDQEVVIENGRISFVGMQYVAPPPPPGATLLDLTGKTVFPGLVGMHEHLFYPLPDGGPGLLPLYGEMADSAPRLYLAAGVTAARTAGSLEPYTDISIKQAIDAGQIPGPKLFLTGPYLEGAPAIGPQLHTLTGPDDAARLVDYWSAEGMTSFKGYMHITPAELKAAIDRAHAHGAQSHRPPVRCGLSGGGLPRHRQPGARPRGGYGVLLAEEGGRLPRPAASANGAGEDGRGGTQDPGHDPRPDRPPCRRHLDPRHLRELCAESPADERRDARPHRASAARPGAATRPPAPKLPSMPTSSVSGRLLTMEMQFERDFVKQGGVLMAGCDPTGYGGVLPGFGDQRNLELLVEAGFTPEEAIHIATQNGARWLGQATRFGTIAPARAADLVVVDGNPAEHIADVEKVETVFKDGIGYDPQKLLDSVRGLTGLR